MNCLRCGHIEGSKLWEDDCCGCRCHPKGEKEYAKYGHIDSPTGD